MTKPAPPHPADSPVAASKGEGDVPVVDLRQILGAGREVVLLHMGEAYRLRITARDRLILTK